MLIYDVYLYGPEGETSCDRKNGMMYDLCVMCVMLHVLCLYCYGPEGDYVTGRKALLCGPKGPGRKAMLCGPKGPGRMAYVRKVYWGTH